MATECGGPAARAACTAGNSNAIWTAIIAITISGSIQLNPERRFSQTDQGPLYDHAQLAFRRSADIRPLRATWIKRVRTSWTESELIPARR